MPGGSDGQETMRSDNSTKISDRAVQERVYEPERRTCASCSIPTDEVAALHRTSASQLHSKAKQCGWSNLNHEVLNYSVESAVFETNGFAPWSALRL